MELLNSSRHRLSTTNVAIFLVGNAATWIFSAVVWRAKHHLGYHSGTDPDVLIGPTVKLFGDFKIYGHIMPLIHTAGFFQPAYYFNGTVWPWAYPASAAVLYRPFYLFSPHHALRAFLVFVSLLVASLCAAAVTALKRNGVPLSISLLLPPIVLLLFYPLWFAAHQANIEIIVWAVVACGVLAYWRQAWTATAIFFGLATATKIYPLTLLGLLFASRKYTAFAVGICAAVAADTLATYWLGPTYSAARAGIHAGLSFMDKVIQGGNENAAYDHSIFSLIKVVCGPTAVGFSKELGAYAAVALVCALVLYFTRIRKLPRANQIVALVLVMVLFPPQSYDYTLLHLSLPLIIIVMCGLRRATSRENHVLKVLHILMAFASGNLLFIQWHGVGYGGQVKCLLLLGVLGIILAFPLKERGMVGADAGESLDA